MYSKALAPEYQGSLRELSINTSYVDVLGLAHERERVAEAAKSPLELARARLAVAEACRRLGRLEEAAQAWRGSYRAARRVADRGAMAWALWSGGTLARQCGRLDLAFRWLSCGCALARKAGDELAYGYTLAGIAETRRIRGEYEESRPLHEQLLAHARKRGEPRHIVWALEGLAQIDRNTDDLDSAWLRFEEAAGIAEAAGDERGHAWALRGLADVLSLWGDSGGALRLLSHAEQLCRGMDLASALAYNRKMRGNVLFRAAWYGEAARTYRDARQKFRSLQEPRGEALARLGLIKSLDRLGRPHAATEQDLVELRDSLEGSNLWHTRQKVDEALAEMVV
jgi:tetratricopeptide (TPR) repeat protein